MDVIEPRPTPEAPAEIATTDKADTIVNARFSGVLVRDADA